MKHVMYRQREDGWYRQEWSQECNEKMIWGVCQGVQGHEGEHWCYSARGDYCHAVKGQGSGSIPPGHAKWISPEKMKDKTAIANYTYTKVTDQKVVEGLEKNIAPEKGASFDRFACLHKDNTTCPICDPHMVRHRLK